MKKLTTAEFSTQCINQASTKAPISRVYRYGHPTETLLEGADLAACILTEGRYLVFITHDSPTAKKLCIHLLDAELKPLDGITMGLLMGYGPAYHFKGVRLYTHNQVSFQFLGPYIWTLQIYQQPKWRIPYLSDPFGTRRIQPGKLSCYLSISRSRHTLILNNQPRVQWAAT